MKQELVEHGHGLSKDNSDIDGMTNVAVVSKLETQTNLSSPNEESKTDPSRRARVLLYLRRVRDSHFGSTAPEEGPAVVKRETNSTKANPISQGIDV